MNQNERKTVMRPLVLFSLVRRIYNEFKIDNGVI